MQSLHDLQHGFTGALISDIPAGDTPRIRARGVQPSVRLGIYRNSVFANYANAMRVTYPAVHALVGPGCFAHVTDGFVRAVPSRSGDLNRYGAEFAEFLADEPVVRDLPYLSDVARLEWCMDESFHEADRPPLDLARLAAVPAHRSGELRFVLHPAVRLLRSAYPVRRIRELGLAGDAHADPIGIDDGEDHLLVSREGFVVTVQTLGAPGFRFLSALACHRDFGGAYAEALEVDADFDPAPVLRQHVVRGTIADFFLP